MACKRFRIYPENRSLYFVVVVWDTKRELYKANPDTRPGFHAICRAIYTTQYRGETKRMLPSCGEIHFCRKHLGVGVITHEFLHAALAWARRIRLDFDVIAVEDSGDASEDEERLCYAHGEMVRQFVNRCNKLRLYDA